MSSVYFIGIDVGTQGVRVLLTDQKGDIQGSEERKIALTEHFRTEQSPDEWWDSCLECLITLFKKMPNDFDTQSIKAVSVTSTSGTVIPLDVHNMPLHNALMYSDTRQEEEGKLCREVALLHNPDGYTAFNTSSGLSKMVWYVHHYPDQQDKIHTWVHATDYIIGKLSGNFRMTDYTNALKSGYDISRNEWPSYIYEQLPIQRQWLQEVVPSGTPLGQLATEWSTLLHIPVIDVVAGMTDGCASQVASGAVNPGDWNTTIGTTLVIKGVTQQEIKDPLGRLYCHRHPEGYWMPGGASNTGADWITRDFAEDLERVTEKAASLYPTSYLAYPLQQEGERFPFISKKARGFADPSISDRATLFTANLEGVAFIERLAFELVKELSGEQVQAVYTAGGGSNSDVWLQIRANVLNCPIHKMAHTSGALGAAILASSQTHFTTLSEAANAMTTISSTTMPSAELVSRYEQQYQKFKSELLKRGYLTDGPHSN